MFLDSKQKARAAVYLETTCAACGGLGKPELRMCGLSRKVMYCGEECQRQHWKTTHKKECIANEDKV